MLRPAFHYVSCVETTIGGLWDALSNSGFTARHWWDTSAISDWKVGAHVSLAINGLVRWHLQRMAGNFVEPQEPVPASAGTTDARAASVQHIQSSYAGLTRVSIVLKSSFTKRDGLPGQARQ